MKFLLVMENIYINFYLIIHLLFNFNELLPSFFIIAYFLMLYESILINKTPL